ncbi:MAG: hypothetical protein SOX32_06955, partial [Candidatus Choladocola sp.]|nr:hypothetical protein [Candidatus Choladocola sp.]
GSKLWLSTIFLIQLRKTGSIIRKICQVFLWNFFVRGLSHPRGTLSPLYEPCELKNASHFFVRGLSPYENKKRVRQEINFHRTRFLFSHGS